MSDFEYGRDLSSNAYLLLAKIVREVGDHDLVLAWDAVFWWSALLAWLLGLGLACLGDVETLFAVGSSERFVGGRGERRGLAWNVGRAITVGGSLSLAVGLVRTKISA